MDRTRVNIAVGLFLVVGILALGYLSIKLGRVSFLGGGGYAVTVDFPSVGGLKPGSTVEVAGVEIGRVEKIASQTSRTIVASEGFAGICRGGWSDLGEFPVAGFSKAARVYGLPDETSAA